MRPDLAAFRELDTLVRNLSDQLASYRRRALSAEQRVREMEHAADELTAAANRAHDRAEMAALQLAESADELRTEKEAGAVARSLAEQHAAAAAEAAKRATEAEHAVAATEQAAPMPPAHRAVLRENEELRKRLEEASARTRELGERLRFLRQQLATVPEK